MCLMIVSHQLFSTNVTHPIRTSPAAQNKTRTKRKEPKLARNINVDKNDFCPDSLWKQQSNCLPVNTIPLTLADQNKKVAIGDCRANLESSGPLIKRYHQITGESQSVKRKKPKFSKSDSMLIS